MSGGRSSIFLRRSCSGSTGDDHLLAAATAVFDAPLANFERAAPTA
ncbi:MAG: hypothetical protein RQ899_11965 [Pseudomonadales bacterium]|nr:hypothetical protein [Pseudomonadales bacterium]